MRNRPLARWLVLSVMLVGIALSALFQQAGTWVPESLAADEPAHDTPKAVSVEFVDGLNAVSRKDGEGALTILESMRGGDPERDALAWVIATSGIAGVPSDRLFELARELADWPGAEQITVLAERALYREQPSAGDVLDRFADRDPESPEAAYLLARTLVDAGDTERATKAIRPFWRTHLLNRGLEAQYMALAKSLLGIEDHRHRVQMLLYRNRAGQAKGLADLAGMKGLVEAWAAVINRARDAEARLDAVSSEERLIMGYSFARAVWLRREDRLEEAAAILAGAPRDSKALVDPDAWWDEREILARGLLEAGKAKLAYEVAAGHSAFSPVAVAEAEFLAGWIALRSLGDKEKAFRHFDTLRQRTSTPISQARAWYWMARASDGDTAMRHFRAAARFPGTFYGQLAAQRSGIKHLTFDKAVPDEADRRRFEERELVKAIRLLEAAGHDWRAARIYHELSQQLNSPGEVALLTAMAEGRDDRPLALKIAKNAGQRGLDVERLAWPLGAIPREADTGFSGRALAYSIARQESSFNPGAVSPANARGLLQLLPGTAKEMAKLAGLAYETGRLTSDAAYNATLGSAYLTRQLQSFDGSYFLTFAAYNAGPSRARQWLERNGDPRGGPVEDVIDWIEKIPFSETRNYVQRVMENYQVYKSLMLATPLDIEGDLRFGRETEEPASP